MVRAWRSWVALCRRHLGSTAKAKMGINQCGSWALCTKCALVGALKLHQVQAGCPGVLHTESDLGSQLMLNLGVSQGPKVFNAGGALAY